MMISSSVVLLLLVSSSSRSHAFSSSAADSSASYRRTAVFAAKDTPVDLPEFANADEYLAYMESVSTLPRGFATGSGQGTFVSKEAPSLGNLPIRATVIQLTDGPTESWAACFTSNRVRKSLIVGLWDKILVDLVHQSLIFDVFASSPALQSKSEEKGWRKERRLLRS
jgi:hypothetical protein